tara:strand:+ start:1880 stop:2686 length:807 start_codon:yes stop_codon:yes gene_type:complete
MFIESTCLPLIKKLPVLGLLFGFLVPNAHSTIASDNAYLAAIILDTYRMEIIFSSEKEEDFYCLNKSLITSKGERHIRRCESLGAGMIRENVAVMVQASTDALEACRSDTKSKRWFDTMLEDYDPTFSDLLEMVPVETEDNISQSMNLYLRAFKLEREDDQAVSDVNVWVKNFFYNQYENPSTTIQNIKDLSCDALVDHSFTFATEAEDYKANARMMCSKIDELQTCHQQLYSSTMKLRDTTSRFAKVAGEDAPENLLAIPRVRSVDY